MKSKITEKIIRLLDQIADLLDQIADLLEEDKNPKPDPFNGIDPTNLDPSKIYYVRMTVIGRCLFKGSSLLHYGKEYFYNFRDNQLHNNDIPMAVSEREILEIRESNEKERQSMYKHHPELLPFNGIDPTNLDPSKWYVINEVRLLKGNTIFEFCKTIYLNSNGQVWSTQYESIAEIKSIRESTRDERIEHIWKLSTQLMPVDGTFTDWWVGQRSWNVMYQEWETIIEINRNETYPIRTDKSVYMDNGCFQDFMCIPMIYPRKVKIVAE